MKKQILLPSLAIIGIASALNAQLAYDGFSVPGNYTGGTTVNNGSGGTGWTSNWSASGSSTTPADRFLADSGSLSYSDGTNTLVTTNGSLEVADINPGNDKLIRDFTAPTSGDDIWFSFISDRIDGFSGNFNDGWRIGLYTGGNLLYGVDGVDNTSGVWSARYFVSGGPGNQTSTITGSDIQSSTFIVGQVTNIGTTSTEFNLWLNPADLTNMNSGNASFTSGAFDGTIADQAGIEVSGGRYGFVDEFRVGTSVGDVAPIPEPSSYAMISGLLALGWILLRRR